MRENINEKFGILITSTNTLNDSVLEINLSKNQEVGYLTSESFQMKMPINVIFQQ